jgi:hypothetical protein
MGGVLKISAVRLYPKLLEEAPPGEKRSGRRAIAVTTQFNYLERRDNAVQSPRTSWQRSESVVRSL